MPIGIVKSTTVGRSAYAMAPPINGPRMKPTEEANRQRLSARGFVASSL